MTKSLAYYGEKLIMAVKYFIVQAAGAKNFIHLVNYEFSQYVFVTGEPLSLILCNTLACFPIRKLRRKRSVVNTVPSLQVEKSNIAICLSVC